MSNNPADYAKLKAKWYKKLKDSGFNDLEQPDGMLKSWTSSMIKRDLQNGRVEAMRGREEYYRAAGHFLWDYAFESPLDRKIWEMHAAGISGLDISKALKLPGKGKDTIRKTINRLARLMGVKCRS